VNVDGSGNLALGPLAADACLGWFRLLWACWVRPVAGCGPWSAMVRIFVVSLLVHDSNALSKGHKIAITGQ